MTKRDCAPEDSTAVSALQPAHSRRRISRISEPDLTVVVGGETFLHHSVMFCLASEYFDKMLSSDTLESHTRRIEFPDGDPEEWVRFCRYLEPRSTITADTFPVNEEDAKDLLPWFHLFGMINLLQECDERLSISSPKILEDDVIDVDHQRSTMTEILIWADTATTYDLPETLDATMKELKNAVNYFPEMITTEILESMRPFWSSATGTDLWEAVKTILPDDVKSSHNDATLKANTMLFELVAQSCKVPAQIRTLKNEADFNAIVNLMKKYRSCPRIQKKGCAAFQDSILRNDDNHISSVVQDIIEAIVSAMTAHSNVSEVQEEGCLALGNLACNDTHGVSIAAKHGIEAVVSAMMAHSNLSKVQEEGCGALVNLVCNSNANCVSVAAKHGIDAIVSAMTVHSNVSEVQELACLALGNLARSNSANCILIAAKNGIEAIVSAMTVHSNVAQVQEWGCLALGGLAYKNDANCISIAARHGIEAIVSAMTAHINISEVQEKGCLVLLNLSFNEFVAVRIQLEGGLAVLEQNPNNSHAEAALHRIKVARIRTAKY
jgi:hypothetical protein